jgi:hypothetical protein
MNESENGAAPSEATVRRLVVAVEKAYHRPWLMMWRSFLHGFMTALGATIGTALFFTILIWVFQALGGVDLLRPGVEAIQDLIIPDSLKNPVN